MRHSFVLLCVAVFANACVPIQTMLEPSFVLDTGTCEVEDPVVHNSPICKDKILTVHGIPTGEIYRVCIENTVKF